MEGRAQENPVSNKILTFDSAQTLSARRKKTTGVGVFKTAGRHFIIAMIGKSPNLKSVNVGRSFKLGAVLLIKV